VIALETVARILRLQHAEDWPEAPSRTEFRLHRSSSWTVDVVQKKLEVTARDPGKALASSLQGSQTEAAARKIHDRDVVRRALLSGLPRGRSLVRYSSRVRRTHERAIPERRRG